MRLGAAKTQGNGGIAYYAFVCIQPIGSLVSAIAMTILTVWIARKV